MNNPIAIRKYVREVMALYPEKWFREKMLLSAVDRFMPERLKVDELKEAILWNRTAGYVETRENKDEEEQEHRLTDEGKAKEGLR